MLQSYGDMKIAASRQPPRFTGYGGGGSGRSTASEHKRRADGPVEYDTTVMASEGQLGVRDYWARTSSDNESTYVGLKRVKGPIVPTQGGSLEDIPGLSQNPGGSKPSGSPCNAPTGWVFPATGNINISQFGAGVTSAFND